MPDFTEQVSSSVEPSWETPPYVGGKICKECGCWVGEMFLDKHLEWHKQPPSLDVEEFKKWQESHHATA